MKNEIPCTIPVPNIAFCLEQLDQLIAVLPKTSRSQANVEALIARGKCAKEALTFLQYMLSPRAMNKTFKACDDSARMPRIYEPPARMKKTVRGDCDKKDPRMP
jgi:hypothetical protein